ncbi:MAG: recombinase family protein, partial [Ktedonobacteraceae bacterium]
MRAVIGARVSKDEQAEEGYGLPTQIEKSLDYITHHGYTLVTNTGFASDGIDYIPGIFQEDYTGRVVLRPAIRSLLDAIEAHRIQVVVFHRTNRLGRLSSVQKVLEAELRARGVKVEYVTAQFDTSNHYGRFMRNIFGDVDELDYESIIYQLKTGKEQAVKQGSVMVVHPPYGYNVVKVRRDDGKCIQVLVINEEEARIVRLIFIWYAYGDENGTPLTITGIVNKLTAMREPTRWDTARSRKGEVGLKRRTQPACVWTPSI